VASIGGVSTVRTSCGWCPRANARW
jgi:hypothetical protein